MATRQVKASLAILQDTVPNKIDKGKVIVAGVEEQIANLPNLPFPLIVITSTNKDLEDASLAAAGGNHKAVSDLAALEKKWNTVIRYTGNYITQATKGDKTAILATGYDVTSDHTIPKGEVVSLIDFTAIPSHTGASVVLDTQKQANAQGVLMIAAPQGVSITKLGEVIKITMGTVNFFISVNTHHGVMLDGLPAGTLMSAFGLAFNLNGMGPITKSGNDFTPQP